VGSNLCQPEFLIQSLPNTPQRAVFSPSDSHAGNFNNKDDRRNILKSIPKSPMSSGFAVSDRLSDHDQYYTMQHEHQPSYEINHSDFNHQKQMQTSIMSGATSLH
jgi:hypothetical protein